MDAAYYTALYQAFANSKAKFEAKSLSPVAFIDRFRGQPMNPEQFEYYPLPALFIQRSASWQRVGQTYKSTWHLIFHVVSEPTWESSNIATNQEEGLKYFNWLDLVREVLDNFTTGFTGTMYRGNDETIDSGVVFYETLGYSCEYYGSTPVGVQYVPEYPNDITFTGTLKRKRKTETEEDDDD